VSRQYKDMPLSGQVWVHGVGDSHMECKGVSGYDGLMAQLEQALNSTYGCNALCRHFGRSGDTSGLANPAGGNLMERVTKAWAQYSVPTLCIVEIGANDVAASPTINAAGTTKNIKSMIRAGRNGVYGGRMNTSQVWTNGIVDNYTNLPAGMPIGAKFLVQNDTGGSDGINATYPSGNAPTSGTVGAGNRKTMSGASSTDQIWISVNGSAGANGWYRTYNEEDIVGAGGTFTPTVRLWVVEGLHFYQSESGGSPSSSLQTLRAGQQQAVTDLLAVSGGVYTGQVIYVDTWAAMDKMVTAGQPKADFSYYPNTSDNHLGAVGNAVVANIIADAINTATYGGSSWTSYLKGN